ncbi:hypothetical protein DL96DRAFT_1681520 [Flagelloscypha sp. PMI_526]|nr:hypothetical protein DL96DRAFT_1681520 [Flagelloscypha sp. PMI_526]
MSDQEVFSVEIYVQIISNISPSVSSAIIEHTRLVLEPRTDPSPLLDSQNRSTLLALSLVSRSWLDICRHIFYSLIFTGIPEQVEKRNQFVHLLEHPLCTFKKHVKVLVLQDSLSGSALSPFVMEFLSYLALLPEAKSLCLREVDFRECSSEEWNRFSFLIFNPEQHSLIFIGCKFTNPDLLSKGLMRCSKLYRFHFTPCDSPTFSWPSWISQSGPYRTEIRSQPSLGASVKDLNISALYRAFSGASAVQTLNTYLHQVCHSMQRLQITTFQLHVGLTRRGKVQEGLDFLAKFIDEKLDPSLLSFLRLNVLISVPLPISFDNLAMSVSRLSNLNYLLLCLVPMPWERPFDIFMRGRCEHNREFIMMMLNSVSSSKLHTMFFLVDEVRKIEDLVFYDWKAIGNALLRPEYANLETVAFDCTGKADGWVEEAVTWLDTHVRKHIPSRIALGVGGVNSTTPISSRHTRNVLQV